MLTSVLVLAEEGEIGKVFFSTSHYIMNDPLTENFNFHVVCIMSKTQKLLICWCDI